MIIDFFKNTKCQIEKPNRKKMILFYSVLVYLNRMKLNPILFYFLLR